MNGYTYPSTEGFPKILKRFMNMNKYSYESRACIATVSCM